MTQIHFAQLSDIHISALGDHHDMLSGRSAQFLADIVAWLNRLHDLDFALISGDLLDTATRSELKQFQQVIHNLRIPCHIIPGNHDRRPPDRNQGLTRREFARLFNPQVEQRLTAPQSQAGYWSVEIGPEAQLIGLDSIKDEDWGGLVDPPQLAWLEQELNQLTHKLVLVAVHHPLHPLAPIDSHPDWGNFVCDNGPEVLQLLDRYPQVKLVLTGHHHLTKVDRLGQRLHLACPAVALYPCAFRTFRLTHQAGAWQVSWQTHPATDESTTSEALEAMVSAWRQVGFDDDFVQQHVALARGNRYDQTGTAML